MISVLFLLISSMPTAAAASVSEIRNTVLEIARDELGYTPAVDNITKYGDWYGYQGAWCTTFAIWCIDQADRALGTQMYKNIVPEGGSCVSMRQWFLDRGTYRNASSGYQPRTGDFIFFDWNGDGKSQHVGLVSSADASRVVTVEGNASGKVKSNTYSLSKSTIMGYGIPQYDRYASSADGAVAVAAQPIVDTDIDDYAGVVVTQKLNIRKAPDAEVIATISSGTIVNVSAVSGSWLKVDFSDGKKPVSGYADNSYIVPYQPPAAAGEEPVLRVWAETDQMAVGQQVTLQYEVKPEGTKVSFSAQGDCVGVDADGTVSALQAGESAVLITGENGLERVYTFSVAAQEPIQVQESKHTDITHAGLEHPEETAGTVIRQTVDVEDVQEKNDDVTATFIATGVCAAGLAGFVPSLKNKKRRSAAELLDRINKIKK